MSIKFEADIRDIRTQIRQRIVDFFESDIFSDLMEKYFISTLISYVFAEKSDLASSLEREEITKIVYDLRKKKHNVGGSFLRKDANIIADALDIEVNDMGNNIEIVLKVIDNMDYDRIAKGMRSWDRLASSGKLEGLLDKYISMTNDASIQKILEDFKDNINITHKERPYLLYAADILLKNTNDWLPKLQKFIGGE